MTAVTDMTQSQRARAAGTYLAMGAALGTLPVDDPEAFDVWSIMVMEHFGVDQAHIAEALGVAQRIGAAVRGQIALMAAIEPPGPVS
jgi:hypothetical protein